jgi:hypothetical protein
MALLGQFSAQILQFWQKLCKPKSMGYQASKGLAEPFNLQEMHSHPAHSYFSVRSLALTSSILTLVRMRSLMMPIPLAPRKRWHQTGSSAHMFRTLCRYPH